MNNHWVRKETSKEIRKYLETNKNKNKNHEKLAEALKKMINTPDERIQIGQKGYEHVVENFNRKKLPEKLNTIIQSILKIKH